MTKIGFNVLAWSANVSEDLLPIIEKLKNIGYDGVEFFVGGADESACKTVGKYAHDLGLGVTTVTVVGPVFLSWAWLNPSICLRRTADASERREC